MNINMWHLSDPQSESQILNKHTEEILEFYERIIDICRQNPRNINPKTDGLGTYFKFSTGQRCLIGEYLHKYLDVPDRVLVSMGNTNIALVRFSQSHINQVFHALQYLADAGFRWGEIGQYINKTIFGKDWWEA